MEAREMIELQHKHLALQDKHIATLKDVLVLQERLDAANLQLSDMKSSIQDLRDLLAEVPSTSSRPFILGARRRLKELDERYTQKPKQEPKWSVCSCTEGMGIAVLCPVHGVEKRKEGS